MLAKGKKYLTFEIDEYLWKELKLLSVSSDKPMKTILCDLISKEFKQNKKEEK